MRITHALKIFFASALVFSFYLGYVTIVNNSLNGKTISEVRKQGGYQAVDNNGHVQENSNDADFVDLPLESNDETFVGKPNIEEEEANKMKEITVKPLLVNSTSAKKNDVQIGTKKVVVTTDPNVKKIVNEQDHTNAPIHIFYYTFMKSTSQINYGHFNQIWSCDHSEYKADMTCINSSFYPKLGPYASDNVTIIEAHMKMISSAGIDVVVVSWLPPPVLLGTNANLVNITTMILDKAKQFKIKVAFQLEDYIGRSAITIGDDIKFIQNTFKNHDAFYTMKSKKIEVNKDKKVNDDIAGIEKPIFYIFNSSNVGSKDWKELTSLNGSVSIRHTKYDSILIGLLADDKDRQMIVDGGLDGFYTYYGGDEFTFGSTVSMWPILSKFADENNLLFIPSVAPGFDNSKSFKSDKPLIKERASGEYYKKMWSMAHTSRADIVSITSFNHWSEGTQIEPAIKFTDTQSHPKVPYVYKSYDKEPDQYLHITLEMVKQFFTPHSQDIEAKISNIIQAFYYPWYGSPKFDHGFYLHWNHTEIEDWHQHVKKPLKTHNPPDDIASVYYPKLGPYSSRDTKVIDQHFEQMAYAKIGVAAISWYPKKLADDEGVSWDDLMPVLLNAAHKKNIKVTFHMEPYKDRSAESLSRDIKYVIETYGSHPALLKMKNEMTNNFNELPLFYIYDSYRIRPSEWTELTTKNGRFSIRDLKYDSILIGLLVENGHKDEIVRSGFDGFYTYFAADKFSYGSTISNWGDLSSFAKANKLMFIPSVGPGYDDTRVRKWNSENTKARNNGEYYRRYLEAAYKNDCSIVSITSFNEWHEGTQIEAAIPFLDSKTNPSKPFHYEKYTYPNQYLDITREMVENFFEVRDVSKI
uniref:Glycoprotein endo-alpha-1,2-mannosidase n=1 Tax=Rhabditophanes sp. KR3021 TaxID=114890 RepID=A0AC35TGN6_9BILA